MAYIGRQLARGENKLFDDISSSFNGSTTVFNLTVSSVATSTATPFQLFVSLGGVMQKPNTDFTTAGNQITFTTAPAAGLSCWIMMQGDTIDQAAIPDSSVTPSKISGSNFAFSGDLRLNDADSSNYVGFKAPTTVSSNIVWTLPAADTGVSGYVLSSNGSGVLSWVESGDNSSPSFTGDVTLTDDGALVGTSSFNATYTGSVKTYTVTVASKSAAHRYNGSGSGSGYKINGKESPFLTLTPGRTYKFDQADGSNSGHPLRFYLEANKTTAYTTGVTTNGTAGNAGAYTQIVVSDTTPQVLHYQCSAHALMGNAVQSNSNVSSGAVSTLSVSSNATISGNLTVSGTTTTVDSVTLSVKDKNIEMGVVSSPSDTTADGGGITLKGASDKSFNWVNATDAWTSSEHIHLIDNKKLFVGGASGTTDGLEIVHNGSNSIINDSGTGTLQLQLGGSTKLEVTSGGINVTGAISVGGAALASGNTFTAVANGAIANNRAVKIDTDGKVSQIQTTPQNRSVIGTVAGTNTGQVFYINDANNQGVKIRQNNKACTVYDPDTERVVIIWCYSNQLWSRVGTPNKTTGTVTWGNRTLIQNDNITRPCATYDTVSNKIVCFGFDGVDLSSWVGTVASSGNSMTWTSDSKCSNTDCSNGSNTTCTADPTTGRVILAYTDTSDSSSNNWGGKIQIGYVNSGVFTWHTGMTSSNNMISTDMFGAPGKVEHHDIISVGDSKFLYVCSNANAASGFTNTKLYGKIIITGTSTTAAPTYANSGAKSIETPSSTQRGINPAVSWDSVLEKILVQFTASSGGSQTNGGSFAMLCYFNAGKTDITINDAVYDVGGGTVHDSTQLVYDSGSGRFVSTIETGIGYVQARFLSCGGTGNNTLTVGGVGNAFNRNPANFGEKDKKDLIDIGGGHLFSFYTDQLQNSTNGTKTVITLTIEDATNFVSGERYVGFADQAYTNGQTATIKTYGNHVDTLSGLTIGSRYFVQGDGTVGTSSATPVARAGLAIAANKLIIMYPTEWGG